MAVDESLQQLQAEAERLMAGLGAFSATVPNEEVSGKDPSHAVTGTVGADGVPVRWELDREWRRAVRPEVLGTAFVEAMNDAGARRLAEWSERFETAAAGPAAPVQAPRPDPEPRPLSVLLEDILQTDPEVGGAPAPEPATDGAGEDGQRSGEHISVTFGPAHQVVDVTMDEQWLARAQTPAIVNEANELLEAAGRERSEGNADRFASARAYQATMNQAFAEALGHLTKLS